MKKQGMYLTFILVKIKNIFSVPTQMKCKCRILKFRVSIPLQSVSLLIPQFMGSSSQ